MWGGGRCCFAVALGQRHSGDQEGPCTFGLVGRVGLWPAGSEAVRWCGEECTGEADTARAVRIHTAGNAGMNGEGAAGGVRTWECAERQCVFSLAATVAGLELNRVGGRAQPWNPLVNPWLQMSTLGDWGCLGKLTSRG